MTQNTQKLDSFQRIKSLVSLSLYCDVKAWEGDMVGETLIISEEERVKYLLKKHKNVERSKANYRFNNEMTEDALKKAFNAKWKIAKTTEGKSWEYNSCYAPLYEAIGAQVIKKKDALSIMTKWQQDTKIFFIDGEDDEQVAWAKENAKTKRDKIILVNGNPFELMLKHDEKFYFDLDAELFTKMGLEHVPALVEARKDKIVLTEVVL